MVKTKKSFPVIFSLVVFIGIIFTLFIYSTTGGILNDSKISQNNINKNNCLSDDCLLIENLEYPVSSLPDTVKKSLDEAIADEYKALGFYEAVIVKFGSIRPFAMIKGAEETHISMLKSVYDKYGLSIPSKPTSTKISVPATKKESCQIGYEAEITNANLYKETLLPSVASYPDITQVFTNLMEASQQKHLAAFDKCN